MEETMKQKILCFLVILCCSMLPIQAGSAKTEKKNAIIPPYMLLWENYMVTKIIIIKKREMTGKKEEEVMERWQRAIKEAVEEFKDKNPKAARKSVVYTEIIPIRSPSKEKIDTLIANEMKKKTFGNLVRLGILIIQDDGKKGITAEIVRELAVPYSVFIYVVNKKSGEFELLI